MKTVKFTDKKNISKSIQMKKSDTLFALRFKKPHPDYSDKKAKKIFHHNQWHLMPIIYPFQSDQRHLDNRCNGTEWI
ncbi:MULTISPECIES: hypothetical protein [Pantoea]|uniref:Uncharacterized protein n=1 Tax=Candidatus Pantoea gossypiicola TaxID=2608008 RepID=A0AB34CK51_9GAMM|nr:MULTISPECIES: hypothetical protein [Pantoea]KAA5921496.1 hypothetical protein F3I59_22850 [Pantoea sp. VH_8]KAA5927917.1 hypothetical protein F3I58_23110 [Pantoea sp. VH_4]KAA5978524.1 hypothetical protein F3I49_22840 [Pantoea sp. M_4]KAA6121961.1 hypothetical protein F3I20_17430 [Pantoea gossypiicola]